MYMQLSPLEGRAAFGEMLNRRKLNGIAVEVGTHRGVYANAFLQHWKRGTLHCVDPYISGYDPADPASNGNRTADYEKARQTLTKYKDRVKFIQSTSEDAALRFEDNTLDFVYVDAKHRFEDVFLDLSIWYPKVKPSGVLAGHDFICPCEPDGGWGREIQPAVLHFAKNADIETVWMVREGNTGWPWSYYMERK